MHALASNTRSPRMMPSNGECTTAHSKPASHSARKQKLLDLKLATDVAGSDLLKLQWL